MKTSLLLVVVACFLPALSNVACAREEAVNVHVSNISVSFPDPTEGGGPFGGNKEGIEVTLGFLAPEGYQFLANDRKFKLGVTDATGVRRQAEFDSFFARISNSGTSAKCSLSLKERLVFPLKLDGAIKMEISEGVQVLPVQEFEVKKGAKFNAGGMEITVADVMGEGKEVSKIKLGFEDTLNVREITLTDEQGGKLDVQGMSKGSNYISGAVPSCVYTYIVKKMPARMKATVVVNKGAKAVVVPLKMTVDVNAPSQ